MNKAKSAAKAQKATILVTGATGFIGRWLILELLAQGHRVSALMRKPATQLPDLKRWIEEKGGDATKLIAAKGDLSQEHLGLSNHDLIHLSELEYIFHLGAAMQWNLDIPRAREVNVRPIKVLSHLAEQSPNFKRFVQMSGFMINNQRRTDELGLSKPADVSDKHWHSLYKRLGSYEASKYESHFQLLQLLNNMSIPYTVINPGVVIGHSQTGEITQYDSIVAMIHELYKGNLPAIPGTKKDWLPVIPIDYVAKFTAGVINQPESINQQYTLIDDRTPDLASMLDTLSEHFDIPKVTRRIPVKLLKTLAKLGLERFLPLPSEPLSFISDDQFDIKNTKNLASKMDIVLPTFDEYFKVFAEHLLASRFLQMPIDPNQQGFFVPFQDGKVHMTGNRTDPQWVLLHGLPLNSESWSSIEAKYPGKILRIDLPGLGRSSYNEADFIEFLSRTLSSLTSKPILMGHSAGSGIAVELAKRHPELVNGLVLIAPYFTGQAPAKWMTNQTAFTAITKFLPKQKLLGLIKGEGPEIENARTQITMDAESRYFLPAIGFWLDYAWKNAEDYREYVKAMNIPILLIAGEHDLSDDSSKILGKHAIQVIANAGHNPQITHPDEVLSLMEHFLRSQFSGQPFNRQTLLAS